MSLRSACKGRLEARAQPTLNPSQLYNEKGQEASCHFGDSIAFCALMRAAIVVLLLATLGLGAGLLYRHNEAIQQEKRDLDVKMTLTNRLEDT